MVSSPDPQNPLIPIEEGAMSNVEMREAIHSLTQVLATQVARDNRVKVFPNSSTTVSNVRDFTRMNSPTFFGSKMEEDVQGFTVEVFMVLDTMWYILKKRWKLGGFKGDLV